MITTTNRSTGCDDPETTKNAAATCAMIVKAAGIRTKRAQAIQPACEVEVESKTISSQTLPKHGYRCQNARNGCVRCRWS